MPRLTNSTDEPLPLVLEPWGEIVELAPKTTYEVVVEGPDSDELEIDIEDSVVKVWAPSNSSLEVRKSDDGSAPRAFNSAEWASYETSMKKRRAAVLELREHGDGYGVSASNA